MVSINRYLYLSLFLLNSLFASSIIDKEIKQEADNIAMLSANAVYHLDDLQLPSILKPFLKKNKNIKALYIVENLEGEKLVSFYRDDERLIFNKKIPLVLKELSIHESNVSYDNQFIGKVVIYYTDSLDFTKKEKEWLNKKQKIKYAYNPEFEPFEWRNELEKHAGIVADILKIIEEKSGIVFEPILTSSYKESLVLLENDSVDMVSVGMIEEAKKKGVLSTKHNMFLIPAVGVERSDSKDIYLNDNYDLKGKKIAVLANSILGGYLKGNFPSVNIVYVKDVDKGFNLLRDKRVDIFALNSVTAQYFIKRKGYDEFKVYKKFPLSFALKPLFSKQLPSEALSVIDKVLLDISEEQKNEIFRKWTNIHVKKEIHWDLLIKIALVFSVIIVLIIYWNRKLHKTVEEKTSELKKLNENLEERVKQEIQRKQEIQEHLFRSEKLASMGEMIGNIAHQWRQPLSIISTAATGMKLQHELGLIGEKEIYSTCNIINENAQYLSNTIDDFRNFIKGEQKKELLVLSEVIMSCTYLINSTIKSNHIKVIYNLDDSISINSSKNELVQVFLNIMNNAKDALKNIDEEERFIFIETFIKGDLAYIVFKDSAGGISEEIKDKIFEPYFTTKHKSQGTGLGLHMAYRIIVEAFKGDITVKNEEFEHDLKNYKGAKFIITLNKI